MAAVSLLIKEEIMQVDLDKQHSLSDIHGPTHCENKLFNGRCGNVSYAIFFSEEDYKQLQLIADDAKFYWIRDESKGIALCQGCQKLKEVKRAY